MRDNNTCRAIPSTPGYISCDLEDRDDGYLPECVLPHGHDGEHAFRTPENLCVTWETNLYCDCEHCRKAEGDYCYSYSKISLTEFNEILKGQSE